MSGADGVIRKAQLEAAARAFAMEGREAVEHLVQVSARAKELLTEGPIQQTLEDRLIRDELPDYIMKRRPIQEAEKTHGMYVGKLEFGATGEGTTVAVMAEVTSSEASFRQSFVRQLGAYYGRWLEIVEDPASDTICRYLLKPDDLETVLNWPKGADSPSMFLVFAMRQENSG